MIIEEEQNNIQDNYYVLSKSFEDLGQEFRCWKREEDAEPGDTNSFAAEYSDAGEETYCILQCRCLTMAWPM